MLECHEDLVVTSDNTCLQELISFLVFFFGVGRGLNPGPCIYYALSLPTELSSRERFFFSLIKQLTQ